MTARLIRDVILIRATGGGVTMIRVVLAEIRDADTGAVISYAAAGQVIRSTVNCRSCSALDC